jgi:hypothetical protein
MIRLAILRSLARLHWNTLRRACDSKTKRSASVVTTEQQCTNFTASIRYDSIPRNDSEDMFPAHPLALLNDEAVYRRTPAGQRELTGRHARLSALEQRFLSAVTGHTPLRVLLDLGLDEPGIGDAIVSLAARGLIGLERSE